MRKRIISLCLVVFFMFSGCTTRMDSTNSSTVEQSNQEEVIEMKNIVIFGDSYSTFDGYIPKENLTYYPSYNVLKAEQTWWGQLLEKTGANLVLNDSWSGSTICNTGYSGDCSRTNSFIYRYEKLKKEGFFEKNEIDTIFVFGGTNDYWAGAPLGEKMTSGWTDADLYYVLPAICYFMDRLKMDLPEANIVFIINNTDISEEISSCIEWAAEYFGVKAVKLQDVQKKDCHPTAKGMTTICNQIMETLSIC